MNKCEICLQESDKDNPSEYGLYSYHDETGNHLTHQNLKVCRTVVIHQIEFLGAVLDKVNSLIKLEK